MTLVEEYYELNEADEVAVTWKIFQILFYGASAGFGLWSSFTMAVVRLKLGDRCYLYTKVEVSSPNTTIQISDIEWESDAWCNYYQFSLVSSFIVGIIWAAFYLMCGKGGKSLTGLPQPWRIVWPSLIFNLCYFLATLGISISVQDGTNYFCRSQEREHGACNTLQLFVSKDDLDATLFQVVIVPRTAWACAISWLVLFFLSFFRIVFLVDFRLYKICVFRIDDTIQNKKEEVLKITNYEDPKGFLLGPEEEASRAKSEKRTQRTDNDNVKVPNVKTKQTSLQSNTAFYVTNDKMLSKRKKIKNPLDEVLAKNLGGDQRRLFGAQSKLAESEFQSYRNLLLENLEKVNLSSAIQKESFSEDKSESESEILVEENDPKESLIFKKLM